MNFVCEKIQLDVVALVFVCEGIACGIIVAQLDVVT